MKIPLLFIFFGILSLSAMSRSDSSYEAVMKVIDQYSAELKREKKIRNTAYGLHYAGPDKVYDGKIHEVDLGYCIDKSMNYDEARVYFYELVDGLLTRINQNEKLKDYFYRFPIGYEDLRFDLSLDYESKGYLKKDEVRSIHIYNNQIFYFLIEKEGFKVPKGDSQIPRAIETIMENTRCIKKPLPEKPDLSSNGLTY
ncbi:MAG: hypothetical protein A3E80_02180 [Chlamydiae bacterium RIFCSPHIGHO2_12_FULL_49_9]|nr:MAG: hypothetical protein A3E80_02180 [Chlamydiae bacterium RIFCSPHIGHO2_12_FULL_49_9]